MLNTITIMGRLTRDPEVRKTNSSVSVASFTLACDRDYQRDAVDFISCVAWREKAEFIERNFHKGQLAVVRGSLQSRKWVDKEDNSHTEWELNVDNIYFGGDKKADNSGKTVLVDLPDDDGEIPF